MDEYSSLGFYFNEKKFHDDSSKTCTVDSIWTEKVFCSMVQEYLEIDKRVKFLVKLDEYLVVLVMSEISLLECNLLSISIQKGVVCNPLSLFV